MKQIACGENHTVALTSDGSVHAWGVGNHGQLGHGRAVRSAATPTRVEYLVDHKRKIAQIACGAFHTVALGTAGSTSRAPSPPTASSSFSCRLRAAVRCCTADSPVSVADRAQNAHPCCLSLSPPRASFRILPQAFTHGARRITSASAWTTTGVLR